MIAVDPITEKKRRQPFFLRHADPGREAQPVADEEVFHNVIRMQLPAFRAQEPCEETRDLRPGSAFHTGKVAGRRGQKRRGEAVEERMQGGSSFEERVGSEDRHFAAPAHEARGSLPQERGLSNPGRAVEMEDLPGISRVQPIGDDVEGPGDKSFADPGPRLLGDRKLRLRGLVRAGDPPQLRAAVEREELREELHALRGAPQTFFPLRAEEHPSQPLPNVRGCSPRQAGHQEGKAEKLLATSLEEIEDPEHGGGDSAGIQIGFGAQLDQPRALPK